MREVRVKIGIILFVALLCSLNTAAAKETLPQPPITNQEREAMLRQEEERLSRLILSTFQSVVASVPDEEIQREIIPFVAREGITLIASPQIQEPFLFVTEKRVLLMNSLLMQPGIREQHHLLVKISLALAQEWVRMRLFVEGKLWDGVVPPSAEGQMVAAQKIWNTAFQTLTRQWPILKHFRRESVARPAELVELFRKGEFGQATLATLQRTAPRFLRKEEFLALEAYWIQWAQPSHNLDSDIHDFPPPGGR